MGVFRFRLFGFPVQVQPSFFALALVFGYLSSESVRGALMWLAVVFISILAHELGHALLARRYGQEPVVYLNLFGGLTSWRQTSPLSRWKQIWVTLAGPGAGVLLAFAATAALASQGVREVDEQLFRAEPTLPAFLALIVAVNFFYSAVNLLPVLPLDGGQVMALLLGPKRRHTAGLVSLIVGLLFALVFIRLGHLPLAIVFGFFGVSSYLQVRQALTRPELPEAALKEILGRARALQERAMYGESLAMAMAVFESAPSDSWRLQALEIAGWSAVMAERAPEAGAVLARVPVGHRLDALLDAGIRELDGDLEGAASVLSGARQRGDQRPELVGSLIRVWLKLRDYTQACTLAATCVDELAEEDVRRLGSETLAAGLFESGAALFERLFQRSLSAEDALSAARGWVRGGNSRQASELLGQAVKAERLEWSRVQSEPELQALVPREV